MKLSKDQIKALREEHRKAKIAERKLSMAIQGLAMLLNDFTGVDGECDLLKGDGFGFTPNIDNTTYMPIDILIKHAENGIDITEDFMLSNLSI